MGQIDNDAAIWTARTPKKVGASSTKLRQSGYATKAARSIWSETNFIGRRPKVDGGEHFIW